MKHSMLPIILYLFLFSVFSIYHILLFVFVVKHKKYDKY